MPKTVDSTVLQAILDSLSRPTKPSNKKAAAQLLSRITNDGWATLPDIEDIFYLTDVRVDDLRQSIDARSWCDLFEIPIVTTFDRPGKNQGSVMGSQSIAAFDVAGLLIELERVGYAIDPAPLVDLLFDPTSRLERLTSNQLSVFWYRQMRHKWEPLVISAEMGGRRIIRTIKLVTDTGYKVEAWIGEDGMPVGIEVRAPKYRRRPEPVREICEVCGYEWSRGDTDSSAAHRREHKKRLRYLDPQPVKRFVQAIDADDNAERVTFDSPQWKHREIHLRALAFKREFGYDFVQWGSPTGDDDPDVQGFLFNDGQGKIAGACAFRRRIYDDQAWWALQWVWIAPKYRRSGLLSDRWLRLRREFGDFHVEPPVSESMAAFLRNMGDEKLMDSPISVGATE